MCLLTFRFKSIILTFAIVRCFAEAALRSHARCARGGGTCSSAAPLVTPLIGFAAPHSLKRRPLHAMSRDLRRFSARRDSRDLRALTQISWVHIIGGQLTVWCPHRLCRAGYCDAGTLDMQDRKCSDMAFLLAMFEYRMCSMISQIFILHFAALRFQSNLQQNANRFSTSS